MEPDAPSSPVVVALSCGSSHSAALLSCDVVATWGRGEDGQLGHGNADQVLVPRAVRGLLGKGIQLIACGAEYTVAVCQEETYSWGWGDFGRLGHGDSCDLFLPKPISFFIGHRVCQLACGDTHTLVATENGKLYSFGRNQNGQLGLGHTQDSLSPQLVQALEGQKVSSVACGAEHSAISTIHGQVYAWGWGRYGNLGHGQFEDRHLPSKAQGLDGQFIVKVVCGWRHSVTISDKGLIHTFGWSRYGQLGHGNNEDQPVPKLVEALSNKQITTVSGGWRHTMAADDQGVAYGWGWNQFGQLGLGDCKDRSSPCSVTFPEPTSIQQLACGWRHTLAVSSDGRVFSWGRGVNGQLGTGAEQDVFQPTLLTALCKGVMTKESLVESTAAPPEVYIAPSDRYAVVPNGSEEPSAADGDVSVVPSVPGSSEAEPPAKKQR